MATEAEFKQQMKETEEFERKRRNQARSKKAQMMRGGMANGKVHMYSAGGAVTDNAGLRALKLVAPKDALRTTKL